MNFGHQRGRRFVVTYKKKITKHLIKFDPMLISRSGELQFYPITDSSKNTGDSGF